MERPQNATQSLRITQHLPENWQSFRERRDWRRQSPCTAATRRVRRQPGENEAYYVHPSPRSFRPGQQRDMWEGTKEQGSQVSPLFGTCEPRLFPSGEIGIRTRDAGFPTYRISNPALSATQPSLRSTGFEGLVDRPFVERLSN